MTDRGGSFFIGELAERTGLSRDAIRYYENRGLLPEAPRTESGYRLYGVTDVDRVAFIGQAQVLGLTLEEIQEVLEIVDRGRAPCVHVRERLATRLRETRERVRTLRELERRLEAALEKAEQTAGEPGAACHCPIIEAAGAGGGAR